MSVQDWFMLNDDFNCSPAHTSKLCSRSFRILYGMTLSKAYIMVNYRPKSAVFLDRRRAFTDLPGI